MLGAGGGGGGDFPKNYKIHVVSIGAVKFIYMAYYKCNSRSRSLHISPATICENSGICCRQMDYITLYSFNSAITCSTVTQYSNGYDYLILYTFVSWRRLSLLTVGHCIMSLFNHRLDIFYRQIWKFLLNYYLTQTKCFIQMTHKLTFNVPNDPLTSNEPQRSN